MKKTITIVFMCNALMLLNHRLEAMTFEYAKIAKAMNAIGKPFSQKGDNQKAPYAPTFVEKETFCSQNSPQDHAKPFCFDDCYEDETTTELDKSQKMIVARNYLTYLSEKGFDPARKNEPKLQRAYVQQDGLRTSIQEIKNGLLLIENEEIEKITAQRRERHSQKPVCGMLIDVRSHRVIAPKNTDTTNSASKYTEFENIVSQEEQSLAQSSSSATTAEPLKIVPLVRDRTKIIDSPLALWAKEGREKCPDVQNQSTNLHILPTGQPCETDAEGHTNRSSHKVTFLTGEKSIDTAIDTAHEVNKAPRLKKSASIAIPPSPHSQPSTPTSRHAVFSVEESEEQALSSNETSENGSFFFS